MKRIISTLFLGGTLAAAMVATAAPASAECSDTGVPGDFGSIPQLICVGYDECDAPICINP